MANDRCQQTFCKLLYYCHFPGRLAILNFSNEDLSHYAESKQILFNMNYLVKFQEVSVAIIKASFQSQH